MVISKINLTGATAIEQEWKKKYSGISLCF